VNLYNVFLNNKIPFVLLESNESENVIYCKSFSDYLFNVGTFVTKTREVILEYVTEGEDKYVVADVTLDDGTCYRDVRFKIVVNEKIKTPHSTINLNILTNKTHVELPQQLAEIIEETQNVVSEIAEAQLPEMYDNTEAVQKALELERQIFEQREQLKQEKKNFEIEKKKAQIVLEKASTITKEIYEQIKPELEVYKNKLIVEFKRTSQKDLNEYVAKKLKEDFDSAANIDKKIQELVEKNSDLEFIREEIKTYVTTTVNTSLQDAKNYARKILDLGGGGGSVAVQYANGGTMNGDLNVNASYLSGGVNLLDIFVTSDSDNQILTYNNSNYDLFISSGNTVNLSSINTTFYTNSSKYESTYTTVSDNSANWSEAYSNLTANSAAYLSAIDISLLAAASGSWNSNYTTVSQNSAYWADTRNNVTFERNVTIQGNLTALGTSTFQNTVFTTTSALSVVSLGPGPALYVFQAAGTSDVASFYDGDGVEVLHVGNAQGGGNSLGQVGINTSFPTAELTVNGAISSNGTITAKDGNSNNWILNGGNAKGANLTIGTNDNNSLILKASNIPLVNITSESNVGIGYRNNSPSVGLVGYNFYSARSTITPTINVYSKYANVGAGNMDAATGVVGLANYTLGWGTSSYSPAATTPALAIAANEYIRIPIYPLGSYSITINGVSAPFYLNSSASGPQRVALLYSTQPIPSSYTTIIDIALPTTATDVSPAINSVLNASNITITTASTGYFYIVPYNSISVGGQFRLLNANASSNDVQFTGSVLTPGSVLTLEPIVPNERLTVVGNISSSNIVYALNGNSNNWSSNYNSYNSISSRYTTLDYLSSNFIRLGGLYAGPNPGSKTATTPVAVMSGMYVEPVSGYAGFYTNAPVAPVDIRGSTKIIGFSAFGNTPTCLRMRDDYLYVLCQGNNTLNVFDTSTSVPQFVASAATYALGSYSSLAIQGNYAYVATTAGIQSFNVSTTTPVSAGFVGTQSNVGTNFTSPSQIVTQGKYAYAAYTNPSFPNQSVYNIVDISDPTKLSHAISTPSNVLGGNATLAIQGNNLYYGFNFIGGNGLYQFNLAAKPVPTSGDAIQIQQSTVSTPVGMAAQGRYVYYSGATGFFVIDTARSGLNRIVATLTLDNMFASAFFDMVIQRQYAYVLRTSGIYVINISNPRNPVIVQRITINLSTSTYRGMVIRGRYLYFTDGNASAIYRVDLGGSYVQQLEAGGIHTENMYSSNVYAANEIAAIGGGSFGNGLNVQGAANVQGSLSITPASGTQTFSNYFSVVSSNPATTSTVFAVTNTNRVGIGTASPGSALTVVGDISATGVVYASGLIPAVSYTIAVGSTTTNSINLSTRASGVAQLVYTVPPGKTFLPYDFAVIFDTVAGGNILDTSLPSFRIYRHNTDVTATNQVTNQLVMTNPGTLITSGRYYKTGNNVLASNGKQIVRGDDTFPQNSLWFRVDANGTNTYTQLSGRVIIYGNLI
jgi:hypothetical protein